VFGNRQELYVAEPHFQYVLDQKCCQLPIIEKFSLTASLPGAKVNLKNGHGRLQPVCMFAFVHPILVVPVKRGFVDHDGGRFRTLFDGLTVGIRFQQDIAVVAVANLIFVKRARFNIGNEYLPYTTVATDPHGINAPIPVIKLTYHTDAFRIRCPYGEQHAANTVDYSGVRTQKAVGMPVFAFTEQMEVKVR